MVALAAAPDVAAAHPAPFSYLDLIVRDTGIDGVLVIHVVDLAYELQRPENELLQPDVAARERDRVAALVERRLTLRADGRALVPQW